MTVTYRAYVVTVFAAWALGFEGQGFNVQGYSSRVIRFEIEIDFEGQGGVQVCTQLLTLNCETDEFEERNHQVCASAYVLVRRLRHAGPGSRWGKCWITYGAFGFMVIRWMIGSELNPQVWTLNLDHPVLRSLHLHLLRHQHLHHPTNEQGRSWLHMSTSKSV